MLFRHFTALLFASTASALFAIDAAANPQFSVENQSDKRVKIHIYNGDDPLCAEPSKTRTLEAGESKDLHCNGHGKGRCKIEVLSKGKLLCEDDLNTCNSGAMRVKNDSYLIITRDSDCELE
mgnify:FL=1